MLLVSDPKKKIAQECLIGVDDKIIWIGIMRGIMTWVTMQKLTNVEGACLL
jgi:hypothetical protein